MLQKIHVLVTFFSLQLWHFRSKVSKQLTVKRVVQRFEEVGSALDKEYIMGRHEPIWTHETLHIFAELLIVDHSVHFGHSDLGLMSHCTIT
jgi:hypothetical protein